MDTNWAELFTAVFSSRKFNKFFDGADFILPDGEKTNIKIASHQRMSRLEGYRFSKYSFAVKATSDRGIVGYGFGEGENELLTFQKSIAEAIERVVYLSIKPYQALVSSNGWAAHLTEHKAKKSALNELAERDAILSHWLTKTPFLEIDPNTFPAWLKEWCLRELSKAKNFKTLRILLSFVGYVPVIQTVIINDDSYAFVSHGNSKSIDTAIYRALSETCRIVTAATHESKMNDLESESVTAKPWDHVLFYSKEQKFPTWIFGEIISYDNAKIKIANAYRSFLPNKLSPTFHTYRCGALFVSHCESKKIQNLFFGRGDFALKNGLINLERTSGIRPVL